MDVLVCLCESHYAVSNTPSGLKELSQRAIQHIWDE